MAAHSKTPVTLVVTSETTFEEFESICIIDAGEADGFKVKGGDANGKTSEWIYVPTGIPYNMGQVSGRIIDALSLAAKDGSTLNASVTIVY